MFTQLHPFNVRPTPRARRAPARPPHACTVLCEYRMRGRECVRERGRSRRSSESCRVSSHGLSKQEATLNAPGALLLGDHQRKHACAGAAGCAVRWHTVRLAVRQLSARRRRRPPVRRRGHGADLRLRLSPAQAAHNDAVQANKSVQGRMFEGQTPDKAVTTAYNPTAMLY
jgi:hypothetical protein